MMVILQKKFHRLFSGVILAPRERPAAASQRAAGRRRRSSRHSASCPCRYAAMGSITLRMFLNYDNQINKPKLMLLKLKLFAFFSSKMPPDS